jgi:hypothetical protein
MSERGGTRWGRIVVLGCAGLIVLGLAAAAAIFFFVMGAMKRSDVYTEAMAIVERSPSAIAALGEPMKAGLFVSGSINISGGAGEANLSIPLRGPNGKGTVHAVATREAGAWVFTALHLAVDDGETLDLLAEAGGAAAVAGAYHLLPYHDVTQAVWYDGRTMSKVKMTVSLPGEVAFYLRSKPNASSTIAEAVAAYRAKELEDELERAYRDGADEAEELNREWERADAELGE